MSDNQSIIEQQYIAAGDGWDDAAEEASERMIRGQLLKFADWRWTAGKEATPIAEGTRLVALATAAMWVFWQAGRPVDHIVRRPGERLPERDKLSHASEKEWPAGPSGEPQDPWQNTRLVYLIDPKPPRPTRSRPRRGAVAAPSSISATRSRACAPRTLTPRRLLNCARWRCQPGSAKRASPRSKSSDGKTPPAAALSRPARGRDRSSPRAVRGRSKRRRRSKLTTVRTILRTSLSEVCGRNGPRPTKAAGLQTRKARHEN